MAINVNTVYKTVLSIINKEQRGYITPYEFNQIATQVQLEIFETYFENLNQQLRVGGNSSEYANRVKLLEEKIAYFEEEQILAFNNVGEATLPSEVYRLGSIMYKKYDYKDIEVEKTTKREFNHIVRSPLTNPIPTTPTSGVQGPIYTQIGDKIKTLPISDTNSTYTLEYIRKPKNVVWAYTINPGLGNYIFNNSSNPVDPNVIPSTGFQDFEIDETDQTEVILRILAYSGIVIGNSQITQTAAQAVAQQDQLEAS